MIYLDLKYATQNNLTGSVLPGYKANKLMGTGEMLKALEEAAQEAGKMGYDIRVFDGYRPQKAVDYLAKWAKNKDTHTQSLYYPNIAKSKLFPQGYIAERSGHTRGSAVDITLLKNGQPLDMGTEFDFMDALSHHGAQGLTKEQTQNRLLLKELMQRHGFVDYRCEWWHYRLEKEPYPNTYFDFDII